VRILLTVGNYPQLSETYVDAEIAFFLRSGLQVEVWSPTITTPGMVEQVKVHRGRLADAVKAFSPSVIHCHYIHFAPMVDSWLSGLHVPMTVRGHSFDFNVEVAEKTAALGRVKKVYLFPHLARRCKSKKIVPLPVAYDSTIYQPYHDKDRKLVLRLGAGKADKGLADFMKIAAGAPEHSFVLGVADSADTPA